MKYKRLDMKTIHEEARDIPVRDEVDVLVVGAGPAGIMAAQSAALVKVGCTETVYGSHIRHIHLILFHLHSN